MSQSPAAYLREFHECFDLHRSATPRLPPAEVTRNLTGILDEELREVVDAIAKQDLAAIAHELADVVYIAYGTALAHGVDLDAVLAEVHRANMTKLGPDGRPVMMNGRLQKGDGYCPPRVASILGLEPP